VRHGDVLRLRQASWSQGRMTIKLLFVGGQPKGEPEPFSVNTHSGKVLRGIVAELKTLYDFDIEYLDLWENEEDERSGLVSMGKSQVLNEKVLTGWHLIPLGHYVEQALRRNGFNVGPYPHPARHGKRLREILEANIAFWTCEEQAHECSYCKGYPTPEESQSHQESECTCPKPCGAGGCPKGLPPIFERCEDCTKEGHTTEATQQCEKGTYVCDFHARQHWADGHTVRDLEASGN